MIDDESDVRDLLTQFLSGMGMEVQAADGGRAGLTHMEKGGADVVLLDRSMPDMDGLSFLRTLRADPRWRQTRVMIVSGLTELDQVAEAIEAGADEYLLKPVTQRLLREKLLSLGIRLTR